MTNFWKLTGISGVAIVHFITIVIILAQGDDPIIRSIFDHPDCERACWLGIEPGVTLQSEVQDKLDLSFISYNLSFTTGGASNGTYTFELGGDFPYPSNEIGVGVIDFTDGVVTKITLSTDVLVSDVIDNYGAPNYVIHQDAVDFRLVYPEEGIVFYIFRELGISRVIGVEIATSAAVSNVYPQNGIVDVLEDCSLYGQLCSIATATPPPTANAGLDQTVTDSDDPDQNSAARRAG